MSDELSALLHARADYVEAARKGVERRGGDRATPAVTALLIALASGLEGLLRASAIEARRAIDSEAGVVGDESATVEDGDAR